MTRMMIMLMAMAVVMMIMATMIMTVWLYASEINWNSDAIENNMERRLQLKPQSHQAYDHVTWKMKNGPIVERTNDWSQRSYDWSQRSWVIAMGKSVAARSWSRSKPSHTGLTTRFRPTCDRIFLQSWSNLRKNVRLVAEVVRLVAEVVGDRKGQISRNKVDGHVQNWSCNLTTVTQNSTIDCTIDLRGPRLIVRSNVYGYH